MTSVKYMYRENEEIWQQLLKKVRRMSDIINRWVCYRNIKDATTGRMDTLIHTVKRQLTA